MKIAVLNGSPKGMTSVTMQHVLFLKKKLPQHEFTILNVCQKIKKPDDDRQAFQNILDSVAASNGVLWKFPLYYLPVHAQWLTVRQGHILLAFLACNCPAAPFVYNCGRGVP